MILVAVQFVVQERDGMDEGNAMLRTSSPDCKAWRDNAENGSFLLARSVSRSNSYDTLPADRAYAWRYVRPLCKVHCHGTMHLPESDGP